MISWLYPKIYPIHSIYDEGLNLPMPGDITDEGRITIPSTIPCTNTLFEENGVYLIDDSDTIFLYICLKVNRDLLLYLFHTFNVKEITLMQSIPFLEELEYNNKILNIIDQLRKNK